MKIHAYIMCFNEEKTMPFILDYYSKYCEKIVLIDNMSTDGSLQVAARYPKVQVLQWDSEGYYNEHAQTSIKQQIYKNSRGQADWVILADGDEIIYGLEMLGDYKKKGIKLPNINGYHMVSDKFPEYDGGCITEKIKTGSREPHMDKQAVLDPSVDISFSLGMHTFNANAARDKDNPPLKLLHYKFLGADYIVDRNKMYAPRISEQYKIMGIGNHLLIPEQEIRDEVKGRVQTAIKVI